MPSFCRTLLAIGTMNWIRQAGRNYTEGRYSALFRIGPPGCITSVRCLRLICCGGTAESQTYLVRPRTQGGWFFTVPVHETFLATNIRLNNSTTHQSVSKWGGRWNSRKQAKGSHQELREHTCPVSAPANVGGFSFFPYVGSPVLGNALICGVCILEPTNPTIGLC